MNSRLKRNLIIWLIYSAVCYAILLPIGIYITGISISLLMGFFFGILNDILTQLRKANGEKFGSSDRKKPVEPILPGTVTKRAAKMEKWSQRNITDILNTVKSDLKHQEPERRKVNDKNIKRDLYMHVIRDLYSDRGFLLHEKEKDSGKEGCFVKGYVRDVWSYLDEAYDLIHDQSFTDDEQL